MENNTLVIVIVVGVILAAAAMWFIAYRRSNQLRARFGPEYHRALKDGESARKAEAELIERERRVEALAIRPLSRQEHDGFVEEWRQVQAEFVDDPADAIGRADDLLGRVMSTRGYPVSDFDRAAADLSVDHPVVVQHYRKAHDIALRHRRGEADTEDLRKAMIHYRELFDELVEEQPPEPARDARTGNGRDATAKDSEGFMLARDERERSAQTQRQPKETTR
jgi:hypothetical protein